MSNKHIRRFFSVVAESKRRDLKIQSSGSSQQITYFLDLTTLNFKVDKVHHMFSALNHIFIVPVLEVGPKKKQGLPDLEARTNKQAGKKNNNRKKINLKETEIMQREKNFNKVIFIINI